MVKYYLHKNHNVVLSKNHATRILAKMDQDQWKEFKKGVQTIAKHRTSVTPKIKQESYQKLANYEFPIQAILDIELEDRMHQKTNNNVHEGGGIHEAFKVVHDAMGYNAGEDIQDRELTSEEHMYAHLIQQTYEENRPRSYEGWERLYEYDSKYGTIWRNEQDGRYVVTVRGTKKHLSDWWKDAKILVGSSSVQDKDLNDSIKRFVEEHPRQKYDIASHSLGSELVMNGVEENNFDPEEVILFNPGSSPFQSKEHIKKHADNPAVHLFLNKRDPLSSFYSQVLDDESDKRTVFGTAHDMSSHSLGQWF